MSTFAKYARGISIRYGLILFGCLTLFFLLMRLLNLAHIFELRALNFVFVFILLRAAVHSYHRKADVSYYEDFIDFFKVGMLTAAIGIVSFAAFMAIYIDQIDPAFMDMLNEYEANPIGIVSPVVAAFAIILEGMASAIICALIVIQWKKRRTVERPVEDSSQKLSHEAKAKNK